MHRTLRRAPVWAAMIAALIVALPSSSHGEEGDEEEYPGLPENDGVFGQAWAGVAQGGISYASRAKQWVRSPDGMVTYVSVTQDLPGEGDCKPTCVRHYRAGGRAFMVSPEGAPAPYGYLAPMTVRSVGFGLMPVEATVQVSQRREGGYPVPFESWIAAEDHVDNSVAGSSLIYQVGNPVRVDDAVNVRILKVLVDGVDLGLTGDCRASTPAPLTMSSPRYVLPLQGEKDQNLAKRRWYQNANPADFFHPVWGGQLSGTITIPPFTGCTTASGDDLSDLMTLSVSGPDNPVTARLGWAFCSVIDKSTGLLLGAPLRQGQNTPRRTIGHVVAADAYDNRSPGCFGTKKIPYPERPTD